MPEGWVNLAYVLASILFISGLKGLTHPRTAVRGNLTSAWGMLLAVLVTLLANGLAFQWILLGAVIGGLIGLLAATRVQMTQMPEMVAIFNGFGGGASVLVAGAALIIAHRSGHADVQTTVSTGLSGLIGAVTFTGSLIAFGKLAEKLPGGSIGFPGMKAFNALLGLAALACVGWMAVDTAATLPYWIIVALAAVLGVTLTIPIGGADMPVVISLLNSYSGLAAAATGFVLMNNVLIIAGSLVGASGIILTQIMCKAMNRSLSNVLFAKLGPSADGPSADDVYGGKVKATSPEEVAMLFDTAQRVLVVPGYGLAVAQAQHTVRDMANILESRGITVEYGIHPVAGRMPGHMNVLLAEADVPYEKLKEMDEINPEMEQIDVCMVIGANDVVNPVARTDPSSPIAGMPIIDVDKARTVVVVKRSLSPGFAGIPNPLFAADNCLMMFGDGKKALQELVGALKEG
ncbi:MAG TPA: NAD(P)(+) transhydrogenase (Re/Si-specific) subunit beta [Candidatus Krumholzibacteria bacterium]|nr:NAD(P)(+) transhydrogenase (Re/Si-specific) subunit beta [Candidatus Krumholzibacteria bacterium]HRX51595.1 NAD(P)(+) transhydrogenase (Re/Si-specific) subunit beta [Candidatus Krumholzibacteria bacterium]